MRSCVALEVKGVVESLPAESAQVSLHIRVTLEVTVEETLEVKGFSTDPAGKFPTASISSSSTSGCSRTR